MTPREQGIKTLKELGIELLKTNGYGKGKTNICGLSYYNSNHWYGWFNNNYDFIELYAEGKVCQDTIEKVIKIFNNMEGWKAKRNTIMNNHIVLTYHELTQEQEHQKAYNNYMNGGRMSD